MPAKNQRDLAHDLVLPTLLFVAVGGMVWAIRGCSGFGAMNGCVFAGVTWGTAWWFLAHDPSRRQSRPYASAWIILALTVGIGISGSRGWMQWPSFLEGHLQTNTAQGAFVPISRAYGFVWLFIAGVPWGGLGACLLAWCGSHSAVRPRHWLIRLACGIGVAVFARQLFAHLPQVFLPLYSTLQSQYADPQANPNLRRLINDNRAAITHLGVYLGFLLAEIIRRDWRNVKLILTVGLVTGTGWALWQNWKWAPVLWPQTNFNFWRCWESCGGLTIGLAYGLAYFWANRPCSNVALEFGHASTTDFHPDLERLGGYLGLLLGLGFSVRNGLKGWANIYLGNEQYWGHVFWLIVGPLMIVTLLALLIWFRLFPLSETFSGDIFPEAYRLCWVVLIVQNVIAQLVTGPWRVWNEAVFSIYYILLLALAGVIVHHFNCLKRRSSVNAPATQSTEPIARPVQQERN